jgi:hypothetical protein
MARLLIPIVLVLVALGLRLRFFLADLDSLIARSLPDDAFYYFVIARRVLDGQGMTFDGETPATGFHPLWLAIITPLFMGADVGARGPVVAVLVLAAVLTAIAAYNIHRLARWLNLPAGVGLAIALGFSFNFYLIRESVNGLETSLAVCLLSFAFLALCRVVEAPRPRDCAWLGVVSGLAILARSDLAVILVALYGAMLLYRVPVGGIARASAGPVAAVGLISAVSYWLTGSALQSSASAAPWLSRANWIRVYGEESNPGMIFVRAGIVETWSSLGSVSVAALGLAVATILAIAILRRDSLQRRHHIVLLGLVLLTTGILALHFIHGYLRWMPREWYFPAWAIVIWGAVALAASLVLRILPGALSAVAQSRVRVVVAAVIAAGVVATFVQSWPRLDFVRFEQQLELAAAGRGISAYIEDDPRIGAFNAGIISYLSGARVVNLDGVVNQDAARHIRERSLQTYLEALDVSLIVDSPVMWSFIPHEHGTGPYFGDDFRYVERRELARFDRPGVGFGGKREAVILMRFDWTPSDDWDGSVDIELVTTEASRFLDGGWTTSRRDPDGVHRQLAGETAGLLVALEPFTAYELSMNAAGPVSGGPAELVISIKDKPVETVVIDSAEFREFRAVLPSYRVEARNRLTFHLEGAAAASPRLRSLRLAPLGGDADAEKEPNEGSRAKS